MFWPLPPLREERLKHRRRGARRPPAEPPNYPPVFPDTATVMVEAAHVRECFRRAVAHDDDLDDLMQEVVIAAVQAIEQGRYRPDPTVDPRLIFNRWLMEIAFRQFSHFRHKAHRRLEVLRWDPWWPVPDPAQHLDAQRDAREALALLKALPPWARDLLLLIAKGRTFAEIADRYGIPEGTAATRIRRARRRFATLLARRQR